MVFFLLAALTLLAVPATPAAAGPITINTALPVSPGQIIIRGDAFVQRAGTGQMDQSFTAVATPAVLVYGLTRDLALVAMGPVFVHKSDNLTTQMGRISRGSNGFGDLAFLARYTLLESDHPGSTFRVAPFAGVQAPTGDDDRSDRFGTLPRPLQPGSRAWDPLLGSILTWQTLDWEFDTDAGYQFNTEADGFQFGNVAFTDQSFQYRLWPRELGSGVPAFLYGVVESNLMWQDTSYASGWLEHSPGFNWFIDPGLQYVAQRYIVEVAVQLPAFTQQLAGTPLKTRYAVIAGFRWNLFTPYHL